MERLSVRDLARLESEVVKKADQWTESVITGLGVLNCGFITTTVAAARYDAGSYLVASLLLGCDCLLVLGELAGLALLPLYLERRIGNDPEFSDALAALAAQSSQMDQEWQEGVFDDLVRAGAFRAAKVVERSMRSAPRIGLLSVV